jgi:transcriptional regulator with XRE-family HTH domain
MASLQQPEVSELIREIRSRTGLTQEQLAGKIGVVFTTLSKWERGKANPLPLALKRIEEVLQSMGDRGKDLLERYFPNRIE